MSQVPIRVLLVEDSPVSMVILKRILTSSSEIEVVGAARNGLEALELIPRVQPNVICTDLHMPGMDGLELTEEVMARYPRPILVISASVQTGDTHNIFRLLQAGAVDVLPKPSTALQEDYELKKQELISKIKVLAGVTVFTKHRQAAKPAIPIRRELPLFQGATSIRAIAIGASTGGPQALQTILSQLPGNFPLPILCVQHISEGFLAGLVNWLASGCQVQVKIAQPGELPLPGTVYFAPEKAHLELNTQGQFVCPSSLPVDGHRPSATVLFKSAVQYYGKALVGIILTGMGRDGAAGMQEIAFAGGITIAQDQKTSVVFGMPKEAIALGGIQHILPITEIAPLLLNKVLVKK